ncbi:MAG: 13E12 repeat family protein [Actinomycetota bacterium]|nr:13E12 repeat family protein [Actinomycetota bacterium]MDQ3574159.1 13E12 repeat family protein [Actinomycetota bacterium]
MALRDRLDAKISQAVSGFDAAGVWDLDAATSTAAWLRQHACMTKREAARVASRAKRLRSLPVTAAVWQAGSLSAGQVDAIVANLKAEHAELFARHEAELVSSLAGLSVTATARAQALVDDVEVEEPTRAWPRTFW